MPTRWEVEKAVVKSEIDAAGRHIVLTLLVSTDNETAVIQPSRAPSLSRIAAATGLGRTTVAEHLGKLERAGWVVRRRPTVEQARVDKVCTSYALLVGLPQYAEKDRRIKPESKAGKAGLVQETDQPNRAKGTERASTGGVLAGGASTPGAPGLVRQPDGASTPAGHNKDPLGTSSKNPLPPSAGANESRQTEIVDLPKPETEGQRVNRLARTYTDQVRMSNFPAVQGVVRKGVRANYSDDQITAGLQVLIDEKRPVTTDTLRIAVEGKEAPSTPLKTVGRDPEAFKDLFNKQGRRGA